MSKFKKFNGDMTPKNTALQAASTLDLATKEALETRDTAALIEISKLWMNMVEISQHVIGVSDDQVHKVIGFSRKEDEPHGRIDPTPPDEDQHQLKL